MNVRNARIEKKTNTNPKLKSLTFKDRLAALKNIPRFFKLVWQTSPQMLLLNAVLRISRSAIPLAILYIGKLIIDEVVLLNTAHGNMPTRYFMATGGPGIWSYPHFGYIKPLYFIGGWTVGDRFSNYTSISIMNHAATLDLDQFENSLFYDKLERARQQTVGRTILLSQVMGQVQDLVTIAFLSAGLVAFNPWLISIVAGGSCSFIFR
jgi:ATP-binding cassette subfamily B protein